MRWTQSLAILLFLVCLGAISLLGSAPKLLHASVESANRDEAGIVIEVAQEFFNNLLKESISRKEWVQDCILDYPIRGWVYTRAQSRAELVAHPSRPLIDLVIDGTTQGCIEARQPPIRVYTDQVTTYSARKRFWLRREGIFSAPSRAHAWTHLTFLGICSNDEYDVDPGFNKLAYDQFVDEKSLLEWITSRRAEDRIVAEVEGKPKLRAGGAAYSAALKRYQELGIQLKALGGSTTCERMTLRISLGSARPPAPPSSSIGPAYLVFHLHEVAINHVLQALLSEHTFSAEGLEDEILRLLSLPASGSASKEKSQFTFVKDRPGDMTFGREDVALNFRFAKVVVGEQRYTNVLVAARYKVQESDGKKVIIPLGKIEVLPLKAGQDIGGDAAYLQGFLRARLLGILPKALASREIRLPGTLEPAGPIVFHAMDVGDGWLSLAWQKK